MTNALTKLFNLNSTSKKFVDLLNNDETEVILNINSLKDIKLSPLTIRTYLQAINGDSISIQPFSPILSFSLDGQTQGMCAFTFKDGTDWIITASNDDFCISLPENYGFTENVTFQNGAEFNFPIRLNKFFEVKDGSLPAKLADALQETSLKNKEFIRDYCDKDKTKIRKVTYYDSQTGEIIRDIDYITGDIYTCLHFTPLY